ncbi:SET and MYND domain-containing protein 4-like [Macrobrachium nipponense]|uniref:SET and MYND domain-containing protein 4-like n=1 Tax=Macrobrachium nipponense TaxID=159736 RepID=UPI0030C85416
MSAEKRQEEDYEDRKFFSDHTLHSLRDGFFKDYLDQIDLQTSQDFIDGFIQCKTDEERFVRMWNFEPVQGINVRSSFEKKDGETSELRRNEGNRAFAENNYAEASALYSKAIIFAPQGEGGECLSLSYANRSAALFHQGKYQLCLRDIELAMEADYPRRLLFKVLDRKGLSLTKLGRYDEAKKAFSAGLDSLCSLDMETKKLQHWTRHFSDKIRLCDGRPDEACESEVPLTSVQVYGGANPSLPSASRAVTIQFSDAQGRFAATGSPVPVGEVLISEKPYATVLKADKRLLHCHSCFCSTTAPVPCPWCSGVAFCSIGCRDLALATHHKWECKFLALLQDSGMSLNCFLALRIISQHGLGFFKKIRTHLQELPRIPSPESPHRSNDYLSVHHLVRLEDKRPQNNFIPLAIMATFLLKVLRGASFFGNCERTGIGSDSLTDDEVFIGSLLLRNLQIVQFNAHEVSGMDFKSVQCRLEESRSVFLGLGIYPTAAFCNHACYPSVTRYFEGTKLVLVSLRPLQPGDTIAENYGPIFTKNSLESRQKKLLSTYWFRCACEACLGNWPVYDKMNQSRAFCCQKCGDPLPSKPQKQNQVICNTCGTKHNVAKMQKALEDAHKCVEACYSDELPIQELEL